MAKCLYRQSADSWRHRRALIGWVNRVHQTVEAGPSRCLGGTILSGINQNTHRVFNMRPTPVFIFNLQQIYLTRDAMHSADSPGGLCLRKVSVRPSVCPSCYLKQKQSKAKQKCVMGVGNCLYDQLEQTKNKQCKSAIILQCYHPHLSDFCSRPRLTQPYNHIIYPGVAKIYLVFFWKCLLYLFSLNCKLSWIADITISGKLFHTFTILGAKDNFLK